MITQNQHNQISNPFILDAHIVRDATARPRNEWVVSRPIAPISPGEIWNSTKNVAWTFSLELIDWIPKGRVKLFDFHAQGGATSTLGIYAVDNQLEFVVIPIGNDGTQLNAVKHYEPLPIRKITIKVAAALRQPEYIDDASGFVKWHIDGQEIGRHFSHNIHGGIDNANPYLQLGLDGLTDGWPDNVWSRKARFELTYMNR